MTTDPERIFYAYRNLDAADASKRGITVSQANRDLLGDVFLVVTVKDEHGREPIETRISGTTEYMLSFGGLIEESVQSLLAEEAIEADADEPEE